MVSEWIDDSPKAPAMSIFDRPNACSPGGNCPGEHGIGILHDHHQPHSAFAS
jgi:hypothetical protein